MLNLLKKSKEIQVCEVDRVLENMECQLVMIDINMKGFYTSYDKHCFMGWADEKGIYIGSIHNNSLIPWESIQDISIKQVVDDIDILISLDTDCSIRIYNV